MNLCAAVQKLRLTEHNGLSIDDWKNYEYVSIDTLTSAKMLLSLRDSVVL